MIFLLAQAKKKGIFAEVLISGFLATCSDDLFIKLWNIPDDYKNFATLRGHEHSISSVVFLPGDNQLISSSRDTTVRVWDVHTRFAHGLNDFISFLIKVIKSLRQSFEAAHRMDSFCST